MTVYKYKLGELSYLKGFKSVYELNRHAEQFPNCKDGVEFFKENYKMNRLTQRWEKKDAIKRTNRKRAKVS